MLVYVLDTHAASATTITPMHSGLSFIKIVLKLGKFTQFKNPLSSMWDTAG